MLESILDTAKASVIVLASIAQDASAIDNFYSQRVPVPAPNSAEVVGFVRAISWYPSNANALRHRLLFDIGGNPFAVEAFYSIGGAECPNTRFLFNVLEYKKEEGNRFDFKAQIYPPLSISIDNSDSTFNLPKGQHHWEYDTSSRRYFEDGPKDLTSVFDQVCAHVRK